MDKKINITYVDDKLDNLLSRYLHELHFEDIKIQTKEVEFDSANENYITLLEKDSVQFADIIIIDSKLFENQSVDEKFSGEEFKMIYTTAHPYSKVIVISQNDGLDKYGTIKKYDPTIGKVEPKQFYDNNLGELLRKNSEEIFHKRNILKMLKNNSEAYKGSLIVEKINELMQGSTSYKDLTDEKIDSLIELIEKNMKSIINEEK
ncbi:hypothetical protein ACSFB8_11140 [Enterococcus faecalis]